MVLLELHSGFLVAHLSVCLVVHSVVPEEVLPGVYPVAPPLARLEGFLVVPPLVRLEVNMVFPPLVHLEVNMVVPPVVPPLVHLEVNVVDPPLVCLEVFLVAHLLRVNIMVLQAASLLVHPVVQDQLYPVLYHLEVSTVVPPEVHPLMVNMWFPPARVCLGFQE